MAKAFETEAPYAEVDLEDIRRMAREKFEAACPDGETMSESHLIAHLISLGLSYLKELLLDANLLIALPQGAVNRDLGGSLSSVLLIAGLADLSLEEEPANR